MTGQTRIIPERSQDSKKGLGFALDIIFGVIPAVFLGLLAGLAVSTALQDMVSFNKFGLGYSWDQFFSGIWGLIIISTAYLATFALIFCIFNRQPLQLRQKEWLTVSLILGIALLIYTCVGFYDVDFLVFKILVVLAISVSLSAIKQIFLLWKRP